MSYFNKFFGIYVDNEKFQLNFLGFEFIKKFEDKRFKNKSDRELLIELIQSVNSLKRSSIKVCDVERLITTAFLHNKTFGEFKNKYQGREVVLVGAGPTVNYFTPVNNAVYVGCNRAFKLDKINFDYLFSIDKAGIENYYEEFAAYKGNNCIKFMGDQNMGINYQIPENYINSLDNVRRYKSTSNLMKCRFAFDIDTQPLGNFASVSLQAIQFILYTNPKKVYVVGIDCTLGKEGHFTGKAFDNSKRNENIENTNMMNINAWKSLVDFVKTYYPDTEIISVNPVGLKGIFKDVYTKAYLDEHPEIMKENNNIEILEV